MPLAWPDGLSPCVPPRRRSPDFRAAWRSAGNAVAGLHRRAARGGRPQRPSTGTAATAQHGRTEAGDSPTSSASTPNCCASTTCLIGNLCQSTISAGWTYAQRRDAPIGRRQLTEPTRHRAGAVARPATDSSGVILMLLSRVLRLAEASAARGDCREHTPTRTHLPSAGWVRPQEEVAGRQGQQSAAATIFCRPERWLVACACVVPAELARGKGIAPPSFKQALHGRRDTCGCKQLRPLPLLVGS